MGDRMVQALDSFDLCLLNDGVPTRLGYAHESSSVLDLTMASTSVAACSHATTLSDNMGSDHFPIEVEIGCNAIPINRFAHKIHLSEQETKIFARKLERQRDMLPLESADDALSSYEVLVSLIRGEAMECASGESSHPRTRTVLPRRRPAPWWNDICSRAVQQRKQAMEAYKHCPTAENYSVYRKRADTSNSNVSTGRFSTSLRLEAISKLCPPYCALPDPMQLSEMEVEDGLSPTPVHSWLADPISKEELDIAIRSSRKSSSPGLDQISHAILTALPSEFRDCLLGLFNRFLKEGRGLVSVFRAIEEALASIFSFLRDRGLELSASKSQGIIFTRKRRFVLPKPAFSVNGQDIPMVSEVRFLGVVLDSRLDGSSQIRALISRGRRISYIIAFLAGTRWGAHPHCLLTLYRSLFRGSIEYGSGYRMSTPINVMLAEAKEMPLYLRFRLLIQKYLTKNASLKFNPVIDSFWDLQDSLIDSQSVLDILSSPALNHPNYIIATIKSKLEQAARPDLEIVFIWVPSHKGILGNETADRFAKEAAGDGLRPYFKVPYTDLFAEIKDSHFLRFETYLQGKAALTGSH
ncbi:hypothetical protein DMN91_004787 [Ooceraea biroi]|uniref:Endonuclease/exonuclease/phosphatase domain-containing protein n=1 Tax=Ooceraea biroi TaxID=2015173 RepID=A0A3L8DRN3_OOCBI|nr:hypothetical protein DMN91_004787 [Ooceraea biroi]